MCQHTFAIPKKFPSSGWRYWNRTWKNNGNYNILNNIFIDDPSAMANLMRTLTDQPSFGLPKLVHRVFIDGEEEFIVAVSDKEP